MQNAALFFYWRLFYFLFDMRLLLNTGLTKTKISLLKNRTWSVIGSTAFGIIHSAWKREGEMPGGQPNLFHINLHTSLASLSSHNSHSQSNNTQITIRSHDSCCYLSITHTVWQLQRAEIDNTRRSHNLIGAMPSLQCRESADADNTSRTRTTEFRGVTTIMKTNLPDVFMPFH